MSPVLGTILHLPHTTWKKVVTGGDSGDNVDFKQFFLSPPWNEVVTGGDSYDFEGFVRRETGKE